MVTAITIDDDEYAVELFCEYLEILQVKVLGKGYNGKEAVELYEKFKPDIVFLDLLMPDYDGIYALENIRKANPDAFVVVITAVVDQGRRDKIIELKPNHVIQKPFDPEQIVAVVNEIK